MNYFLIGVGVFLLAVGFCWWLTRSKKTMEQTMLDPSELDARESITEFADNGSSLIHNEPSHPSRYEAPVETFQEKLAELRAETAERERHREPFSAAPPVERRVFRENQYTPQYNLPPMREQERPVSYSQRPTLAQRIEDDIVDAAVRTVVSDVVERVVDGIFDGGSSSGGSSGSDTSFYSGSSDGPSGGSSDGILSVLMDDDDS